MPDATDRDTAAEWGVSQLDLAAYLRRISYDGDLGRGGRPLAALHRAHLAAIPFENADIMLGRSIAVDLPSIQDKLVHHRRGGYCYEHGLLLAAALERLGYRVDRMLARVGGAQGRRTHLMLRVDDGQQCWLADVGFGTGLLEPVPFDDDSPHAQSAWTYRLREEGPRTWQLQEQRGDGWTICYQFDDLTVNIADITVANHFNSTNPGSSFARQLVVIHKDAAGLRLLTSRRLTIAPAGRPSEERFLGDDDFAAALTGLFGLQLDRAELARLTAVTRPVNTPAVVVALQMGAGPGVVPGQRPYSGGRGSSPGGNY
jgi:N-hydroxyarylamine O-acetyltransferase